MYIIRLLYPDTVNLSWSTLELYNYITILKVYQILIDHILYVIIIITVAQQAYKGYIYPRNVQPHRYLCYDSHKEVIIYHEHRRTSISYGV